MIPFDKLRANGSRELLSPAFPSTFVLSLSKHISPHRHARGFSDERRRQPARFAALSTALTLAVATSSSMPTPQTGSPSGARHST